MRWNSNVNDHNDKGYPKVFKNPMWFIVHQDLMKLLLKGLPRENNSNKKALLEALETRIIKQSFSSIFYVNLHN